ncbi:S-methyl-5-thioribose kinase [Risungbinella massiliensis]|uniref:S-methyl-5-thioribose kinase n=1 Tax=Risungbinella massiliensis TaxID=1329796 RepID=UPI0005CB87B9|nr:S-methyl-5-thioribose kinase [Risungbinella massiliensis]
MTATVAKNYQPLTVETVKSVVEPLHYFDQVDQLEINEIGDGNLNYIFHLVEPATSKSLIVKQALPYAKVVGESWPLTLDRARIESESLKKAAELVPELVPQVLYTDHTLALTVMEDLSSHTILRKGLIAGKRYPKLAEHIGTYTAQTLFHTSDFFLHPFAKKELVKEFLNPELCKITEDLVLTDPFFDHETNEIPKVLHPIVKELWDDQELKREVAKLKFQFLTEAEALLHGDLHSGSIFVTEESTKVIDPEFAFVGPIGFDLGQFFANLLLNYLSQEATFRDEVDCPSYRTYLLDVIKDTWNHFTRQFRELWSSKGNDVFTKIDGSVELFLDKVWVDTIGFAGCEVIRRTIGLAQVEDLNSIQDLKIQYTIKQKALRLGTKLIKKHKQLDHPDLLLRLVQEGSK